MRYLVIGTMFLGLVIATDLTYLGSSRSLAEHEAYRALRLEETRILKEGVTRPLTDDELKTQTEASGALSQIQRHIVDWQAGSFLALGFVGCGLIWLVMLSTDSQKATLATRKQTILKGSVLGAIVLGSAFVLWFGIATWMMEVSRITDRYEWEVHWLIGALSGALLGGVLGPLSPRLFLRQKNKRAA